MRQNSLMVIIKALNDAGVRYLVVGGVAVIAHGYVRDTKDVDLMIQLERENLLKGLRALQEVGYRPHIPVTHEDFADPEIRASWIAEKQMKVLKLFCDAHWNTPIDVFVDDPLGFDDAYKRGTFYPLREDVQVPVCSYEDLVKLKLQAGRPRDLADLHELRVIRGEK
jgi:predicted nucleotidyltransferase